jgi:hypothetical protein
VAVMKVMKHIAWVRLHSLGCTNLVHVTLPDSLTHVGALAFHKCASLSEVVLPKSLTHLGADAFNGCDGLRNVMLSQTLTHVGDFAFFHCTLLEPFGAPR